MSNLLTKGGLVPGKLINKAKYTSTSDPTSQSEGIVFFMFNPYEYTIAKDASYTVTPVKGQNMGETSFDNGEPIKITLNLYFDSTDTLNNGDFKSVREYTKPLWHMIYIDENSRDTDKDKKGKPPRVEFRWGTYKFEGVVTNLTEKLTLFAEDGTPLRAEVSVTLQQHDDDKVTTSQVQSSWVTTAPKTSTLKAGDRLDLINAVSGTSSGMREVAAANGIDNPLNIPNGTDLIL